MKVLTRSTVSPAQIVVGSFALVIAVGTLLLSLPAASASGEPMRLIDAFFTATSATCVTGLVVLDTGTQLSRFGQIVVLACVQVGGLGLMAFTTIFMILAAHRLRIGERFAVQHSYHTGPVLNVGKLLKYIVLGTIVAEAVGAALLAAHWSRQGRFADFGETLYHAVFHSVSAFCNAGFALYADSLVQFRSDFTVQLIISSLILVGGIGFLVGLDMKDYLACSLRRLGRRPEANWQGNDLRRPRLTLHSKLVLITTLVLVIIGTVSYAVLEGNGVYAGMTPGETWMNSYFAAVTARTAGFNTVDYARMGGAALLCTMVLMFIGASPGSTGGGIKTSTFALLLAYSWSRWRGQTRLHAFHRTVPKESRDRAATVVVAAVALVILGASALMASETFGLQHEQSQVAFLPVMFETVSAFGTVGLSMGATAGLSDVGKLFVVLLMFMGRVGPLTLALAVSRREQRERFRYAEENIMVG